MLGGRFSDNICLVSSEMSLNVVPLFIAWLLLAKPAVRAKAKQAY